MLSKAKIKYIRSLELKKFRSEYKSFVAEGNKLVEDMLHSFECEFMIAKSSWMATQCNIPAKELIVAEEDDIRKVSFLKKPQDVLAVFKQSVYCLDDVNPVSNLVLMLDGVQDPGNLGTIIRLADWFGIEDIVCSLDSADVYNPKVVQATMGALTRVRVHYTDLEHFLSKQEGAAVPVYGTYLDGENVYSRELSNNGIIIMGSEGNGIRDYLEPYVSKKLLIPNYPQGKETSESLNVAIATALVCGEFRRRT